MRAFCLGLGLAVALAVVAQPAAQALSGLLGRVQGLDPANTPSLVSGIPVAVVLGVIVTNTIGVAPSLHRGVDFAVKVLLKLGIVLIGVKLSFLDVVQLGLIGVPVVLIHVGLSLTVALWLARRLGVGSALGALAAASTAICGITATLAVAPSVGASQRDVAYTVANVTLLGLTGMIFGPYVAQWLFADAPVSAGLFLGTAIHDTSQVMGAALTYQEVYGEVRAMEVATVAKLTRNALLVGVVPLLGWMHARDGDSAAGAQPWFRLLPGFVIGFLALSLVRTSGDVMLLRGLPALGLFGTEAWATSLSAVGGAAATGLLTVALAAVGLQTRFALLRGLGPRPLLLAATTAIVVASSAVVLATWVGPLVGG